LFRKKKGEPLSKYNFLGTFSFKTMKVVCQKAQLLCLTTYCLVHTEYSSWSNK